MLREIIQRRSIRKYQSKPISNKLIFDLIKAAQFAPNGRHLRAWEFLVIKNVNIKMKIFDILGQNFLKQAPVLIIPTIDTKKTDLGIQDLAVASENIFLQANAFGLGSLWKNINPQNSSKIKKLLNIPIHFLVINIIPIGYPAEKITPHTNKDFSIDKIHLEKW